MRKLLPSDKNMRWYLDEMMSHVREIQELVEAGDKLYREQETCEEHARVEAYDLIVLAAEVFEMPEILKAVPGEIIDRFNRKR
jgi:hypothetical protein